MVSIALHDASWQMFSVYEVEEVVEPEPEAKGFWQRGGVKVALWYQLTIETFSSLAAVSCK